VTLVVSFTILGQFDALLRGMHLAGDPAAGIGALPSILDFDLSQKPRLVVEHVTAWHDYTIAVGAQFGSASSVVTAHVVLDTILTIPAYLAAGVTAALLAWRYRLKMDEASGVRRAFELITLAALAVLAATVVLDLLKNFFTWYVTNRAWNAPAGLTDANVRLLWFFALARTLGLWVLAAGGLLLLALADTATQRLRRALVAVRSEILLIAVFAVLVLMLPQTADVIRGWHVSHTVITAGLVVVLSMLVRWTSAANLRLQKQYQGAVERGEPPRPRRLRIPLIGEMTTLGRLAAVIVVVAALGQILISLSSGLQVGRGLIVPAGFVVVLWIFGLALPTADYVRGNRPVARALRRFLPRLLGAGVYLILGVAILKAAATTVAYARHENGWLLLALVPPAIGIWRIISRTTHTMGVIEAGFAVLVTAISAVLLSIGNPELAPAALAFTGVTFTYGSLAYFNSYERTSWVSHFGREHFSQVWAQPFVIGAGLAMAVTLVWFYIDPIGLGPRIGTIGMVVIAMMLFTVAGAGAVRFAELTRPPKILAAFGIRRTPVVILFGLWIFLAPTLTEQRMNDVRIVKADVVADAATTVGFRDVWERWEARNLDTAAVVPVEHRRVVPLVLVSSSGGGLRAATWTSFVLDCLFEGTPTVEGPCAGQRASEAALDSVALMSGVSGGALGFAEYAAHLLDGVDGDRGSNDWIDEVLGDDYLAAPVGWLFLVDLPRSLIGFGAGISNRSEVMERTWEASWPDDVRGLARGLVELWEEAPQIPPLIFNATSINDACRFNVSVLDGDGGSPDVPACSGGRPNGGAATDGHLAATYDLVDFLCPGDDVQLSTAAGMASRFPLVSTSGRVTSDLQRCPEKRDGTVFVADGGYLEGSGSGTLLDTWYALADWVEEHNASDPATCVIPFMVHIDNGYESPSVSGNEAVPREFLVPLLATLRASSGITAARAEAALTFEQPFSIGGTAVEIVLRTEAGDEVVASRYARLVTRAHPGVQAPLGWTLSQASIDDLRSQLAIDENAAAFAEIRGWLDGDMVCREQ
jgi:hypothetical protein